MFNNDYYYHIYNRGVEKRRIFLDKSDYQRFLLSLEEFNRLEPVGSLYELGKRRRKNTPLRRSDRSGALVEIICYCLNPNHYHLLLQQKRDGGISEFIKRLSGGYTSYFNNKYNRSGALFQGKYKRKEVKTEGGLIKLSIYINCNAEIHGVDKKENWPWSSHHDFIKRISGPTALRRSDRYESSKLGKLGGLEYKELCEQLLPEIKQVKNLEKYGLE